jgi:hypothetical protein
MGLDITLNTAEQAEHNAMHEAASEALYAEGPDGKSARDRMSDEEYQAWRELNGEWQGGTDVPSQRHPGHLCNRRYLRSSYNESGFNRAVEQIAGQDHGFYWIFEPLGRDWEDEGGELTAADVPALREARQRAEQVAVEIREGDPLRATDVHALFGPQEHLWTDPPTSDQALGWYREQSKQPASFASYSTGKGAVFGDGLVVLAATVGRDVLGGPAAILIYRLDKETVDHYVQSAEIAAEFCDEAIGLIERDGSCHLSWSG